MTWPHLCFPTCVHSGRAIALCQQRGLGQRKLCVLGELSGALLKLQGTLAGAFKNYRSQWP